MPLLNVGSEQRGKGGTRWPGGGVADAAGFASRAVDASRRRTEILPVCANPYCRSGWFRLWRAREGPIFEGGWCCSTACTAEQIKAALVRELNGSGLAQDAHRHRIPLGLAMLEQGWISPDALRSALAAQRAAGAGRLGEWLVRLKSASVEQVTRTLGLQWSCPVLKMDAHAPEGLTVVLPRLFVDAFGALPLRMAANRIVYLGFEDRPDPALALAVERITGLRVESGVVEEPLFRPAYRSMLEARYPAAELVEAATEAALVAALTGVLERARPVESRLTRVHECFWLRMWRRKQSGPLPAIDGVHDVIGSTAGH